MSNTTQVNNLTDAQLLEMIKLRGITVPSVKVSKSIMKINKSGGLYFTFPEMKGTSKEGKTYQQGMNIQAHEVESFLSVLVSGKLEAMAKKFVANKMADTNE